PRATQAGAIHDAARLLAVADCFSAATAGRPHRPARTPASAMNELIALGSIGVLDRRIVQSLAEVCGLFPVGSFVRLSDEGLALVIGTDPEHCDRPMVQRLRAGVVGESLDLARIAPWELSVLEAIEQPLAA
ncbi:MAG: hypothetical protein ACT4PL_12450, partial [Phycisphaerales bacterium]